MDSGVLRLLAARGSYTDGAAGDAGFDLQAVSSAKVDALDKTVTKLLLGAGVTDEWRNHTDLEPFNAA